MIFYVSNNILTRLSLLLLLLLSTTITITTIITTFAPVYQPKINTLVVTSVVHRYVYWKKIFNMKINLKRLVSFFSSIWWVNYFEKKKKNLRKTKKKKKSLPQSRFRKETQWIHGCVWYEFERTLTTSVYEKCWPKKITLHTSSL